MFIKDKGIIIKKRSLKEREVILHIISESNGLCSGVLKQANKLQHSCQVGSFIDFSWKARLENHIGSLKCEMIKSFNRYLISNKLNLYSFNSLVSLIMFVFYEKEPLNDFFIDFYDYMSSLSKDFSIINYINIELSILSVFGYKLDFCKCAVTGSVKNIKYLSPKSGKAISYEIGYMYSDKLLPVPLFLIDKNSNITTNCIKEAINITTYFFQRYLFNNFEQPLYRKLFIQLLLNN